MEKLTGEKISRRHFLNLSAKAAAGVATSAALSPVVKFLPQTTEAAPVITADLTKEFIEVAQNTGGFNRWGYRLSNAYQMDESLYTVYQRAIFKKGPEGQITLRPILDELSEIGLDKELEAGVYGLYIPPRRKDTLYNLHNLPQTIIDEVSMIRHSWLEPGDPTAALEDFGPFRVSRLQAIALQQWDDGKLEGMLIGDAFQRMGMIPEEALLPIPQTDIKEEHLNCGAGPVWEGIATYYTRDGCVGCSWDRRMANGEILNDNRLTIAFMRLPLNSRVNVMNTETGQMVPAIVTDRGGFEAHGFIADLSWATREAVGGSGKTRVRISLDQCR